VKISLNERTPFALFALTLVCIYFGEVKNGRGSLSLARVKAKLQIGQFIGALPSNRF